jgi:DNA repair photolyase
MNTLSDHRPRKGRGAIGNPVGRYEGHTRAVYDDGWSSATGYEADDDLPPFTTTLTLDASKTIIATNDSPDIGFDQSINPYRGCEHGCIYCYARPTHAYLGLSPGLDFESRLFYKPSGPDLLEKALSAKNYQVSPIAMGTNTDPYQPVERAHEITRGILKVLQRFNHPVTIVTKAALVTRDIDILAPMAKLGLARVALSVTTLDPKLARTMEPRASSPGRRIGALRELAEAGIPTTVMTAPMIPALNDHELETILETAHAAGATSAGMTLVRLPLEVKPLFEEWLQAHAPGRAAHVMSLIRQCHGGKAYRAEWGVRRTGDGPYAAMMQSRFARKTAALGMNRGGRPMRTDLFKVPGRPGDQMALF